MSSKVIISCFIAGCLEVYDFTIFGFLANSIHKNYLNFLDSDNALIITYGLFAVGFVFRPIGSIIFGYIGDKFGRKKGLVLSVTMMGISSLSMCLLPSYNLIGITSCYLIVLIRAIQGISIGGEYSGALIYTIEHFDKKRAGLVGAIIVSGCILGVMLARVIVSILENPNLPEYSWRFAFLVGFFLSLIGYFIRNNLAESPEFIEIAKSKDGYAKIPLLEGIKAYPIEILAIIILIGTNGVNFYFVVMFLPSYLKQTNNIDIGNFSLLTTIVPALFAPLVGWVSDKLDRAKVLITGLGLLIMYSIVALPIILKSNDINIIALLILGYSLLFSMQSGTVNTYSVEIFPAKYRFSCGAFCYATGMALIGGTCPMISTILSKQDSGIYYLQIYVIMITSLGFILGNIVSIKNKNRIKNYENTTIH